MTARGEPLAPFRGEVVVGEDHLYVEVVGESDLPTVVLLHSGLGSTAEWRATAPALQQRGYRTVVYDRPGHGRSDARREPAPPPFERDVLELVGLMDELGVTEASLIGHSDGGTIALQFAAAQPERTRCVVAVAAHVCVELKTRHGIANLARKSRDDERFMTALARRHGDKGPQLLDGWAAAWLRPEALRWDVRSELAAISSPTMIVQGLDDEYATEDHARDIAEWVDGAELWLEPGVDHLLPQAIPDTFHERVLDFLSRHRAGSP